MIIIMFSKLKLDVAKSNAGSEAPPKSVTLIILKDTPQECSWRVDAVDEKGQAGNDGVGHDTTWQV